MINRRDFLQKGALGATAAILPRLTGWTTSPHPSSRAADSRIEVLFDEPLGTISPNIYGHFVENLSGVLYDGIWVGEKS
jgi:alpha-N-arabinofuranosidase